MGILEQVEAEFKCEHARHRAVAYIKRNGVLVVRLQCQRCGESLGERPKSQFDLERLHAWDEELRQRWLAAKEERRTELVKAQGENLTKIREQENDEFWTGYNAYLETPHWKTLRRQVIRRDGFRCQNCFRSVTDATAHVHHIDYRGYKRLGKSFAFECVTLCPRCHQEYHQDKELVK